MCGTSQRQYGLRQKQGKTLIISRPPSGAAARSHTLLDDDYGDVGSLTASFQKFGGCCVRRAAGHRIQLAVRERTMIVERVVTKVQASSVLLMVSPSKNNKMRFR